MRQLLRCLFIYLSFLWRAFSPPSVLLPPRLSPNCLTTVLEGKKKKRGQKAKGKEREREEERWFIEEEEREGNVSSPPPPLPTRNY